MNNHYNRNTYISIMCNGRVHEALAYLMQYPLKRHLARRIRHRMSAGSAEIRTDHPIISGVDAAYQAYYKAVFWKGISEEEAEHTLLLDLSEIIGGQVFENVDAAEDAIKGLVEKAGFHFQGGKTQGYYGAYIWKKTKPKTYHVWLPHESRDFTIQMMHGFISRSWMDYVTMGRFGTGGWAAKDGLYCVWKSYAWATPTEYYRVSYLKHEAQHALDYQLFGDTLSGDELEYRAKLVELIYSKSFTRFRFFLEEAAAYHAGKNTHGAASYRIIRELSERILESDCEYDITRWAGRKKAIQDQCAKLYDAFIPAHA